MHLNQTNFQFLLCPLSYPVAFPLHSFLANQEIKAAFVTLKGYLLPVNSESCFFYLCLISYILSVHFYKYFSSFSVDRKFKSFFSLPSFFPFYFLRQGFSVSDSFGACSATDSCGPGWPWIHRELPASASQVLGIKTCVTTAQLQVM